MNRKPILCLDFDGVLHSYTSGWKGARNIPDRPTPGALQFIVAATDKFRVAVFSSRSSQWGGRRAMRQWLKLHLTGVALGMGPDTVPQWMMDRIARTAFADPPDDEARHAVRLILRQIEWPKVKPPAQVTIDDRALTFTGDWSDFSLDRLSAFKPWNKR